MSWTLFTLLGLIFLGSCGRRDFPNYDEEFEQREEDLGYYRANLNSVNSRKVEVVGGYVVMWSTESQFYARVNFKSRFANKLHHQYIHEGPYCPTTKNDRNRDGIIDFNEVLEASGKALIPLDQYLGNRKKGFDWFPSSNAKGNYVYSRAASYRNMMIDLRSSRSNPNSSFRALRDNEDLGLDRRVLIIYGDGVTGNLPIACAQIEIDPNPEM